MTSGTPPQRDASVSASHRASELGPRSHLREAEELAQGFARAFGYGGFIYLLFFVLDALLHEGGLPLWFVFVLRVAGGVVLFVSSWELTRKPHTLGMTTAIGSATMALTAVLGGIAASSSGGLTSALSDGMAFYFLGAAAFGPSPWRRMIALTLPSWALYFLTLLLLCPIPADGLPRPFVADILISLGLIGFAAIGGELLWRSRRHIAEVRRLGRYRLDALLERDALSETWRAHDTKNGNDVALELYRARPLGERASSDFFDREPVTGESEGRLRLSGEYDSAPVLSEEQRGRFVEAARAVASLPSPHVMRIFDCGANDDGIAFIAREFIPGERLDSLIRRAGPLETHRALRLLRQLALALADAHRRGVAHRDLRPWNVFVAGDLDGQDTIRVIGWGLPDLVRTPEARDALHISRGPGLFLAPESPTGSGVRADVYGFGAILFWCLTGQAPVEARAGEATWRAHARSAIERPSALRGELLPAGLDALVLACLERDPLQRPEDASRVLERLDQLPVPH